MIRFVKMHGLGNDFMVVDAVHQQLNLVPSTIREWANRHTGVGFDQCLLVEPPKQANVDFNYRIFNANGEEVNQCGNGARCLARFIHLTGLSNKNPITVATKSTTMQLSLTDDDMVSVQLSPPIWDPQHVPCKAINEQSTYTLYIDDNEVRFHAVSVGNPHAVILVDNIKTAPVTTLGKQLCEHPFFPEQVNVGFLQITQLGHLDLRVYERGCGETQACGSGAVAAAVVARRYHQQPQTMKVNLPGGRLIIEQDNPQAPITMIGPATFVYQGEILL